MLAFATVGGVTTGSIVEPIRAANPGANYVEGEMTDVNVIDKNIRVRRVYHAHWGLSYYYPYLSHTNPSDFDPPLLYLHIPLISLSLSPYTTQVSSKLCPDEDIIIPYDYLIYAAGAKIADYGVKGVSEYCSVLKEVDDVRVIKNKVG